MKKILLIVVVFFSFGTVIFAQNKETKKAPKPSLSAAVDAVQKAKDDKQIALKKAEIAKQKNTQGQVEELIKPQAVPATKEN